MTIMRNFFTKITLTDTSFIEAQKVDWGFNSEGMAFLVKSTDIIDAVEYSFDGSTLHGELEPGTASQGMVFDNRHEDLVWFRKVNAGAGDIVVRVDVWRA